ncbi:MAG: rod shape-determining protein MreC [Campylobacterota bacterium]|nr:rod shape-determining protein MreC [Campylobacterota bacterium]
MTKKLFGFLLISIALFMGALYYTNAIQSPIISALNSVNITYNNITGFFKKHINQHFFQATHIAELEEKLLVYEHNHLVMQQLASEIHALFTENSSDLKIEPEVELIRAISYQKFGDFNRIWLEIKEYDPSHIYGLTHKEVVAGIVVSHEGRALGLLNKDIKSTYSVCVGDESAPGIAQGNNAENLLVKFIPAWHNIKEGDEVVTSGMDEIFFKGLKVGKVLSVTKSQGYQSAVVEPYYKSTEPNYFHMIKKIR